jgi:uncharacterized protein
MIGAMSEESPQILAQRLAAVIAPRGRVLTAYSGGVDSTLAAAAARRVLGKCNAPAALGDSASLPRRELEDARRLAVALDLELHLLNPGEQEDADYQANDGRRCFHCKTHLYAAMGNLARQLKVTHIANGANLDDQEDYRPGLQAAKNLNVVSPLVEAGFTKADVRALARHWGLPNADKPAAPCLASRIPHGTPVTLQRLQQVEDAEDALLSLGLRGLRVRHHESVARLELPPEAMRELMRDDALRARVIAAVKAAGFTFVALDLEGFRSGSGNALLTIGTSDGASVLR